MNYPTYMPARVADAIAELPEPPTELIQDGVAIQPRYVPITNTFDVLCLEQLRTVRLANGMRPYLLPLPLEGSLLPAYETWRKQFSIVAGSYLLGFITATADLGDLHRRISVKDSCTGLPLFSDFISARALYTGIETPLGVQFLSAPRLIGDPGLIDVEVTQITASVLFIYTMLLFAVPVVSLPAPRSVQDGGIAQ